MSVTLDVELREERRRILAVVDGHLDDVVEVAVDAIRADIPVYGDAPADAHRRTCATTSAAHYATKVACLGAEQRSRSTTSRSRARRRPGAPAPGSASRTTSTPSASGTGCSGTRCWTAPAAAPAGARRRSRSRRR